MPLPVVTPEALQEFFGRLYTSTKVNSLVHGSISEEDALALNSRLLELLNSAPHRGSTLNSVIALKRPGKYHTNQVLVFMD